MFAGSVDPENSPPAVRSIEAHKHYAMQHQHSTSAAAENAVENENTLKKKNIHVAVRLYVACSRSC